VLPAARLPDSGDERLERRERARPGGETGGAAAVGRGQAKRRGGVRHPIRVVTRGEEGRPGRGRRGLLGGPPEVGGLRAEGDGAIAVVDIDTLWRERATGDESNHWLGRTCKVYALMPDGWKMTMQTGALQY